MNILARSRPHNDNAALAREVRFEAATYQDAYNQARDSVPEGWDLLSVQTVE